MAILETRGLRKVYGSGDTEVRALDGVDLAVEKGEFAAVVGTSGSGKSTLLHMLGGLDRPTSGSVIVDGRELSTLKDEALTIFRRRKIGFVFQNYNLVPVLNVYENIVLPIQLDGRRPDKGYIHQIIETLGLGSKLQSLPNNLSGGQQQRVAIARAMAAQPAIILADEPTGYIQLVHKKNHQQAAARWWFFFALCSSPYPCWMRIKAVFYIFSAYSDFSQTFRPDFFSVKIIVKAVQ